MPGRGDEALLRADVPRAYFCGAKNVDGRDKPSAINSTPVLKPVPAIVDFFMGNLRTLG